MDDAFLFPPAVQTLSQNIPDSDADTLCFIISYQSYEAQSHILSTKGIMTAYWDPCADLFTPYVWKMSFGQFHMQTDLFCISSVSHLFYFLRTGLCDHAETDRNHHKLSDLGVGAAEHHKWPIICGACDPKLLLFSWSSSFQHHIHKHRTFIWEQHQLHCHDSDSRSHSSSSCDSLLLHTCVN